MLFTSSLLSCSLQDEYAATPLIAASGKNHIEVARFLIEHGASVNYQNKVFDILFLFSNSLIIIIITILYSKFLHSKATHLFKLHATVATQIS